jgi:gamma-glutamyltranspeptidase/glutathione hydrolase
MDVAMVSTLPRAAGQQALRASARLLVLVAALLPATASLAFAAEAARQGIASAHPLASEAGSRILAQGGNAFDAAVAVAAALAVVEPYSSGLGGGGLFLLHRARDRRQVMVDARETAPSAADARMFVDEAGRVRERASLDGPLAAAIPGLPAGLVHLSSRYGQLPLARSLAPAIALAREGFLVDPRFAGVAQLAARRLARDPRAAAIFLPGAEPPVAGQRLRQHALADTLERLAQHGNDGFYRGPVAQELVTSVRAGGGIWQAEDLARYRVVEREPMKFDYRGAHVVTASLPSSGGIVLAQSLNILALFPPADPRSIDGAHLVTESLRRAFEERARSLGDPDFTQVPVAELTSAARARAAAASLHLRRAGTSSADASSVPRESGNTTHLSVVDRDGNRVAATLTVNTLFGAGVIAGNTGILLNNEMDDFALPGEQPNTYGLTGRTPNLVAPGKRPLSSMTPTFVETERGLYILGTPGGSRIISMLLLAILDIVSPEPPSPLQIVTRPRFHHQFLPDRIEFEPEAFSADWIDTLRDRGHALRAGSRAWGNMQLVFVDRKSGQVTSANDPRGLTGIAWY